MNKEKFDNFVVKLRKERADALVALFESNNFMTPDVIVSLVMKIKVISNILKELDEDKKRSVTNEQHSEE